MSDPYRGEASRFLRQLIVFGSTTVRVIDPIDLIDDAIEVDFTRGEVVRDTDAPPPAPLPAAPPPPRDDGS